MTDKQTWKEILQDHMLPDLAHEADIFEGQMELRRQGKIDEKVFAETRQPSSSLVKSSGSARQLTGSKPWPTIRQ